MRLLAALLALAACHRNGTAASPPFDGGTHSDGGVAVLTYHRDLARDGHYVDAAFTHAAAAGLRLAFTASFSGHVYAQPLYVEGGASSRPDMLIVATESNEVLAIDPATGAIIWRRTLGPPTPRSSLPCGNIDPLGITGTPASDGTAVYLDAFSNSRHLVFALSLADGSTLGG
jgi:outer membrane protein assembly factor BamB